MEEFLLDICGFRENTSAKANTFKLWKALHKYAVENSLLNVRNVTYDRSMN